MAESFTSGESELADQATRTWRILTGRLSVWSELLTVLEEWHGLTVVVSDPWSGTSGLLEEAQRDRPDQMLLVDARRCTSALDLAMAIADVAVGHAHPKAWGSWPDLDGPTSPATHRLERTLRLAGVPARDLRQGDGTPEALLRAALDVVVELAGNGSVPIVVVDHFGRMLAGMRAAAARATLEVLRSAHQAHPDLGLMLVDFTGGPIAAAVTDDQHPLYMAGRTLPIRRAQPRAIPEDLFITRPHVAVNAAVLREAAELAVGIPTVTWAIVDRATGVDSADPAAQAQHGWQVLRREAAPWIARQWDSLRLIHRAAQPVLNAIALDIAPTSIAVHNKLVIDALHRLRDAGVTWQPAPRTWAIVDPLLAAWVAEHAPPWALRHRSLRRT